MLFSPEAWAQNLLSLQSSTKEGQTTWSVPIQTLLFFTALSFIPAALLLMTSFTRIIIVLSLLRQALGLQASPPNQVLVGIALFLTAFIMSPTIDRVYTEAYQPFAEKRLDFEGALKKGAEPLREFMLKQTRASDLELFARLARVDTSAHGKPMSAKDMPFKAIVPAFVISELKTAFQIGFMIFIPFIMIDLICASVLMSMGMMMVSPVLVALPFKLVLFVLADGWNLLVGSLVASFAA
ncbi:MAG: flagellar type III secretion system pore protein FliP [Lautropia sp.]|nr:flagellar type III secretion system pore protein FliP [Lautropia sp.]